MEELKGKFRKTFLVYEYITCIYYVSSGHIVESSSALVGKERKSLFPRGPRHPSVRRPNTRSNGLRGSPPHCREKGGRGISSAAVAAIWREEKGHSSPIFSPFPACGSGWETQSMCCTMLTRKKCERVFLASRFHNNLSSFSFFVVQLNQYHHIFPLLLCFFLA